MAVERGYESQVAYRAGQMGALSRPEDYGAGLARTVGQVAGEQHQREVRAYQAERALEADRQLTEGSARLAQHFSAVGAGANELETAYGPGHQEAVHKLLTENREALFDGITEDRVRSQLTRQADEFDAKTRGRAEIYSTVKEAQRNGVLVRRTLDTLNNEIETAADPLAALQAGNEHVGALLGGLNNIGEYEREELGREFSARGLTTAIGNIAVNDPNRAADIIASPQATSLLTPQQLDASLRAVALGRQAKEAEVREAAQAQARAAKEAQDAAKDRLAAMEVLIDNGEPPSQGEINAAYAAAESAGVEEADLLKFGFLAEGAAQSQVFRGLSTPQLEDEAQPLRQQQAAGKLDAAGERRLGRLQDTIKARDAGKGRELGPLLKGGTESRIEGVSELAAMPRAERFRVAEEAGDTRAGIIASIPQEDLRVKAVQGGVKREARPHDFLPEEDASGDTTVAARQREAQRVFRNFLSPALVNAAGGSYDDLFEATMDIMAGSAAGWNAQGFGKAIQVAYGRTKRPDGIYQGGIGAVRGKQIELPDRWTTEEFDRHYSRNAFPDAVYANGAVAAPADIRAFFQPLAVRVDPNGATVYRFEGPDGRPLRKKGGGIYEQVVSRDPPERQAR